ncbi:MAG TPA: hypothetical protein VIL95_01430, partial [Bacillota bacterium]
MRRLGRTPYHLARSRSSYRGAGASYDRADRGTGRHAGNHRQSFINAFVFEPIRQVLEYVHLVGTLSGMLLQHRQYLAQEIRQPGRHSRHASRPGADLCSSAARPATAAGDRACQTLHASRGGLDVAGNAPGSAGGPS